MRYYLFLRLCASPSPFGRVGTHRSGFGYPSRFLLWQSILDRLLLFVYLPLFGRVWLVESTMRFRGCAVVNVLALIG